MMCSGLLSLKLLNDSEYELRAAGGVNTKLLSTGLLNVSELRAAEVWSC